MKLHFSILTMLGVTAYLGVVFASLLSPDSFWTYVGTLTWLSALIVLFIKATDVHDRGTMIFGRVALLGVGVYLWLTWLPTISLPQNSGRDMLPHGWFAEWWTSSGMGYFVQSNATYTNGFGPRNPFSTFWTREKLQVIEAISAMNVALAFGLIAGFLAVWRFRKMEGQSKSHS